MGPRDDSDVELEDESKLSVDDFAALRGEDDDEDEDNSMEDDS